MENDLSTGQDVDWKAMARLPQFKGKLTLKGSNNYDFPVGATSHYLQYQHDSAVKNAMMKLELRRDEVTGLSLLAWHEDSERRERSSTVREKEERIIEIFVSIRGNKLS